MTNYMTEYDVLEALQTIMDHDGDATLQLRFFRCDHCGSRVYEVRSGGEIYRSSELDRVIHSAAYPASSSTETRTNDF